jgi:hypothetical protein
LSAERSARYEAPWGAQHWLTPLRATHPQTTGHDCASIVIGQRDPGLDDLAYLLTPAGFNPL